MMARTTRYANRSTDSFQLYFSKLVSLSKLEIKMKRFEILLLGLRSFECFEGCWFQQDAIHLFRIYNYQNFVNFLTYTQRKVRRHMISNVHFRCAFK